MSKPPIVKVGDQIWLIDFEMPRFESGEFDRDPDTWRPHLVLGEVRQDPHTRGPTIYFDDTNISPIRCHSGGRVPQSYYLAFAQEDAVRHAIAEAESEFPDGRTEYLQNLYDLLDSLDPVNAPGDDASLEIPE